MSSFSIVAIEKVISKISCVLPTPKGVGLFEIFGTRKFFRILGHRKSEDFLLQEKFK
jgi:hypothetical protein